MIKTEEYIFWVIPHLAENPRAYWIYRVGNETKAIAKVIFENKEYDVFEVPSKTRLTYTEKLKILEACDLLLQKLYFYNWN